jgi:hypothetical protein
MTYLELIYLFFGVALALLWGDSKMLSQKQKKMGLCHNQPGIARFVVVQPNYFWLLAHGTKPTKECKLVLVSLFMKVLVR